MNDMQKCQAGLVSERVTQAGRAVYAIARLMAEDQDRKDSGDGTEFMGVFERGCLLSGLELIAAVLWEEGEKVGELAGEDQP